MECDRIKKLLSEYMDGVLDGGTVSIIEKHLKQCEDCNGEYISIKKIVDELGSMEPLEAPKDILAKVHERIESSSPFDRIRRYLFLPLRAKIPIELIAMVATVVIIFFVFNIVQHEKQGIFEPITTTETEEIAVTPGTDSKAIEDKTFLTNQPDRKRSPIQLAISLRTEHKPKPLSSENLLFIASGNGIESPPNTPDFGFNTEQHQKNNLESNPVSDIINTISIVEGRLISKEYKNGTDNLSFITLEIPGINYYPFLEKIENIGTLRTPAPDLSKGNKEPVLIRIQLISSD